MRRFSRPAIGHQVAALRRQDRKPKPGRAGRAVIASLTRLLYRRLQLIQLVPPETLTRWHRRLVSRGDRGELVIASRYIRTDRRPGANAYLACLERVYSGAGGSGGRRTRRLQRRAGRRRACPAACRAASTVLA
jgi:hypothetical protein